MSAERVQIHHGDSREVLKGLAASSIDACVCDPPYALVSIGKRFGKDGSAPAAAGAYARASAGFMGKRWDTGETAFDPAFWSEVLRVLKPGAHLVAFGGTRSYHRLACAIEDAGFEIRDMTAWLYGSGFPKSHDTAKAIDKAKGVKGAFGEAKSAAHEGWIERGRLRGDDNEEGWQRPWMDDAEAVDNAARRYVPASPEGEQWSGWGTALKPALEPIVLARKPLSERTVAGNVLKWGTGALNIDGCRVGDGEDKSAGGNSGQAKDDGLHGGGIVTSTATDYSLGRWPANVVHDGSQEVIKAFPVQAGAFAPVMGTEPSNAVFHVLNPRERTATHHHGDSGSAARFFYNAKADADDRLGSKHPTVKPIDLMQWLCRLVTPPGGLVLDPFAGSGTTGLAAMNEGMRAVLVEREAEYVADIRRRIAWATGEGRVTAQEKRRRAAPAAGGFFAEGETE